MSKTNDVSVLIPCKKCGQMAVSDIGIPDLG
jgi:hypothetical protein